MTKAYNLCPGRKQNYVECGRCQGKGKIYDALGRKTTCRVCGGEGQVIIVGDGTIVECNNCNGTGQIQNYLVGPKKCQECKGIGKVCRGF